MLKWLLNNQLSGYNVMLKCTPLECERYAVAIKLSKLHLEMKTEDFGVHRSIFEEWKL